jgi:uncharacterized membrane protein (UPF0127 family)
MIIANPSRGTVVGDTIEVAQTASQKVKGLLGRDGLAQGHGLLFKGAGSLHTLFMRFPIDIIYTDKHGKVVKTASAVRPFKLVGAPLRCYYAIELPAGAIAASRTELGDQLSFEDAPEAVTAIR